MDIETELRLIKNFLDCMTKAYRNRTVNWVVVRDLIMSGTSTAGKTSCIVECQRIGIDPWGYRLVVSE